MISKNLLYLLILSCCFFSCEKEKITIPSVRSQVGIFGGSQSLSIYSKPVKDKWAKLFNVDIVDCGVVGAGAGLWQENTISNQIIYNRPFDVYILWCSTNDIGALDIKLDDENDCKTQSGGLKYCVDLIHNKNKNAQIVLFTSMYVPSARILKKMPDFVDKQISFCEKYSISYLNQLNPNVLDESDFQKDKLHMSSSAGYWKLEPRQTDFLTNYVFKKYAN